MFIGKSYWHMKKALNCICSLASLIGTWRKLLIAYVHWQVLLAHEESIELYMFIGKSYWHTKKALNCICSLASLIGTWRKLWIVYVHWQVLLAHEESFELYMFIGKSYWHKEGYELYMFIGKSYWHMKKAVNCICSLASLIGTWRKLWIVYVHWQVLLAHEEGC